MKKNSPPWFIFLSGLLFSLALGEMAHARKPVTKIKVQSELKTELNSVLKSAVQLQESSFRRNDQATSTAVKALVQSLDSASKKSYLAKEQKTHLVKILSAAKSYLELSRRSSGADRQTYFQKTFHQLVLIAQVYQTDSYKIFFCPKDRSVWLQRGNKPQNPINPETYGNCGKPAI